MVEVMEVTESEIENIATVIGSETGGATELHKGEFMIETFRFWWNINFPCPAYRVVFISHHHLSFFAILLISACFKSFRNVQSLEFRKVIFVVIFGQLKIFHSPLSNDSQHRPQLSLVLAYGWRCLEILVDRIFPAFLEWTMLFISIKCIEIQFFSFQQLSFFNWWKEPLNSARFCLQVLACAFTKWQHFYSASQNSSLCSNGVKMNMLSKSNENYSVFHFTQ